SSQSCSVCPSVCGTDKCFEDVCGGNRIVQVAGGGGSVCALTKSGSVYCWGRSEEGVPGTGLSMIGSTPYPCTPNLQSHLCQPVPTKVLGVDHVLQIGASAAFVQCALRATDGKVLCWGNSDNGQLGHAPGTAGDMSCPMGGGVWCNPTPTVVDGL